MESSKCRVAAETEIPFTLLDLSV